MSRPRIALFGFLGALIAVHAIAGGWQPLQGDDWEHLLWDARHDGGWLASHLALSEAMGYAVVHSALLHAAICGIAAAAIVLGAFAIAHRRLPRLDAWDDVVAVIAVSALIWIAQPRAGFVWFERSNVAWHVCGCAVALWLLAPLRCGWRVGRAGAVALAVAGWLAGTSSRQIALATLIGMAIAVRRTPRRDRARWMWVALGGLVAGTVAGFVRAPYVEPARVWNRGFEANLIVLGLPVREGGQLITLVLLLVLAKLAIDALAPAAAPPAAAPPAAAPPPAAPPAGAAALPEPRETRAWFWTWLAISAACLFGPHYGEATLLPATLALVIGALPYGRWLCTTRAVRWAIIALAIGVHAVAWPSALATYAQLGGEFRERIARLERAPAGSIPVISPYSEVQPNTWTFGEDWGQPSRQLVATGVYAVRDIEFVPRFGRLEDNPRIEIALATDGLGDAQVRAASPRFWATDPVDARDQFEAFVARAERATGTAFTARLVAQLEFTERKGRPLEVAWYERGALTSPKVSRSSPDPTDHQRVSLPPALAAAYGEAYVVRADAAEPAAYDGAAYHVLSMVAGRVAIVACSPARCLLVDAFVPRF